MATRNQIAVFESYDAFLAATLPECTLWVIVDGDGKPQNAGLTDANGNVTGDPFKTGAYIPFASMSDGDYGYSIDSGAGLITEDDAGLLIEMTASSSWEITITGIAPTTGAFFLAQSIHLWATIEAASSPNAGDKVYIRSVTDASNYSEAAIEYSGSAWQIAANRVEATVETSGGTNIPDSLAGQRVWGAQYMADVTSGQTDRQLVAEWYPTSTAGATATGRANRLGSAENVSSDSTTQTLKIGGTLGAGASWTMRLHGIRIVQHAINSTGTPFEPTPTEDQLSHGSYSLSSDNTTALTAAGTWTKIDVVTTAGQLVDFTHTNNKLTYTGSTTKPMQVHVVASTSFNSTPAGAALSYRIAVDGTTVAASNIGRDISTNDTVGAFAMMLPTQNIAPGSYIEVFADSDTDGTLTTTGLTVSIIETVDT